MSRVGFENSSDHSVRDSVTKSSWKFFKNVNLVRFYVMNVAQLLHVCVQNIFEKNYNSGNGRIDQNRRR